MPNYILYPIAPILNTSTACMNRPASQPCIGRVVRLGEQEPRWLPLFQVEPYEVAGPKKEGPRRVRGPFLDGNRCGGQRLKHHYSHLPELTLDLSTKGKGRWPFGWEVLRELKYPDDYPFPPKPPPADPYGWGGARY